MSHVTRDTCIVLVCGAVPPLLMPLPTLELDTRAAALLHTVSSGRCYRRVGHGGGHGGVAAAVHWTLGLTLASLLPSSVLSPGPGVDGDDGDSSPAPRLAAQSLSSLLSVTVCCFYRHLTLFSL